jgi:hypothetical protein
MVRTALLLSTFLGALSVSAATIVGLTTANQLITFDSATPGTASLPVAITGLQAGESVLGIDFRPATGALYGLGSTSRLYQINPATGVATQVGSAGAFALSGTSFGFDFNPVVDRIRVVSDADQNLRLNPNDGTLTATDTILAFAGADANSGANPLVVAAAYFNNVAGAATTTLYGIDAALDILATQNPPNNGTLNTVGPLGVNTTSLVGFDIESGTNLAFASLTAAGAAVSQLYTLNLATGAATLVGTIGGGVTIADISATLTPVPEPAAWGTLAGGLVLLYLRRRRSA